MRDIFGAIKHNAQCTYQERTQIEEEVEGEEKTYPEYNAIRNGKFAPVTQIIAHQYIFF